MDGLKRLSYWAKSEKEKYHDIPYMWNKEREYTNELIYKTETDSQIYRTHLWWPGGKPWGKGIVRQFLTNMYTLLHLKWMANKVLLYSTGDSAQCHVEVWMGGDLWRRTDTCGWIPMLSTWNCHSLAHLLYSNIKYFFKVLATENRDTKLKADTIQPFLSNSLFSAFSVEGNNLNCY